MRLLTLLLSFALVFVVACNSGGNGIGDPVDEEGDEETAEDAGEPEENGDTEQTLEERMADLDAILALSHGLSADDVQELYISLLLKIYFVPEVDSAGVDGYDDLSVTSSEVAADQASEGAGNLGQLGGLRLATANDPAPVEWQVDVSPGVALGVYIVEPDVIEGDGLSAGYLMHEFENQIFWIGGIELLDAGFILANTGAHQAVSQLYLRHFHSQVSDWSGDWSGTTTVYDIHECLGGATLEVHEVSFGLTGAFDMLVMQGEVLLNGAFELNLSSYMFIDDQLINPGYEDREPYFEVSGDELVGYQYHKDDDCEFAIVYELSQD